MTAVDELPVSRSSLSGAPDWRRVVGSLLDLVAAVNAGRSLDEILDEILERAGQILGSDAGAVYLRDSDAPDRLCVRASRSLPPEAIVTRPRVGPPIIGLAVASQRPVLVTDFPSVLDRPPAATVEGQVVELGSCLGVVRPGPASAGDPVQQGRLRAVAARFRSIVAVPLLTSREAIGALALYYASARSPSAEDIFLMGAFADHAALAIENARTQLESEQRRQEVETRRQVAESMRDLVAVINSTHSLDEVLQAALSQAIRRLGADAGGIYLRDAESSDLITARAALGLEPEQLAARIRVGSPVTGLCAQERRPVVAFDLEATIADDISDRRGTKLADRGTYVQVLRMGGRLDPDLEDAGPPRVHSLVREYRAVVAAPLMARGVAHGALSLYYREPREFAAEEIALATAVADQTALAIENAQLRESAERRLRNVEALYRADELLYRSLRLDDVLQALVDVATEILQSDRTSVLVWDEDHERLVPGAVRGFLPESVARMSHAPGEGITGLVAQTGRPILVEDARDDPRVHHPIVDPEGIVSLAHVPITIGREMFGVFGVNYCAPRRFTGEEERLLSSLARKAAVAIENARLYERSQEAAALEERQRLARELHDAVTQTLFSASLIAEVVPRLWDRDPDEARRRLAELRQLTRGALAEMRGLLLELRPGALTEMGLNDLLSQLVQATAGRTPTQLDLRVRGEALALPGDVQVGLYRLVQEALANVVKHAGASQATVDLQWEGEGLALLIEDDGRGFDQGLLPPGHLGLSIMRERAAGIGADLSVHTQPGAGTRVRARWPAPHDQP